jgi:hypothetical protein
MTTNMGKNGFKDLDVSDLLNSYRPLNFVECIEPPPKQDLKPAKVI